MGTFVARGSISPYLGGCWVCRGSRWEGGSTPIFPGHQAHWWVLPHIFSTSADGGFCPICSQPQRTQQICPCFKFLHGDPLFSFTGSPQGLIGRWCCCWISRAPICMCWSTPVIGSIIGLPSAIRQGKSLLGLYMGPNKLCCVTPHLLLSFSVPHVTFYKNFTL